MNCNTLFFKKLTMAAALVLLGTQSHAASGAWNGSQDANWVNSANWSVAPYPSGGDTATFNTAGGVTALDLAGLSGILNITFDTASVGAHTLGAGVANSQTLVMGDGGTFRLNSGAANSQTFNSAVQLGQNTTASYSFRNDAEGQTLTFNNVSGASGGTKTLNVDGSGAIALLGNLARSGSTLNVNVNGSGALTLSGGNNQLNQLQINGAGAVINLAAGTTTTFNNAGGGNLMSGQDCTLNGPGAIVLSTGGGENYADNAAASGTTLTINAKLTGNTGFEYWHSTYRGTVVLAGQNDFTQNVIFNQPGTIACYTVGNKGSTTSNLGAGTTVIYGSGTNGRLLYLGTGETTDRIITLRTDGIIEQGGASGTLTFSSPLSVTSGTRTLTLQGSTAATGEFSGALRNDAGVINLKKEGTGAWTLSAANPYTGTTVINGGKLLVNGANGAISGSSSLTLAAGTELELDNTDSANNADRLRDAMPVTLSGATLTFSNTGGAADFSETVGMLNIGAGANTLSLSQADSGQTATVTFAGLGSVAGTLDFVGTGIGVDNRNRIFITGLAEGPLGTWATVNGTAYAAYSAADGIYALATAVTNIAARGSDPDSVIPDDASLEAHITTAGTSGAITLAGDPENSIFLVQQDTATDAVVATAGKTLKTLQLGISAGQADLTVGAAEGDGSVTPLAAGGILTLLNDDASSVLTVNAGIANNTSASSLIKSGAGAVVLAGSNSYSGLTGILEGTLTVAGSATQTLAGVISGDGALAKEGSGLLTLPVANTYAGLTTVSNGTLRVLNSSSLGASTAGTLIGGGGTLDIGTTAALNLNAEQITVSGAGVNGRGAIVNSTATAQYNFLRLVTLAGDTTFGGEHPSGRWDIRNASGTSTFLMNNYSVTKVGSNYVGLTNVGVTPGATAGIDIQEGWFTIEGTTTLGGSAANTMTVRSGSVFDIYDLVTPVAWSLVMEDNTRFYARAGNATNRNNWAGPVTLNGRAVFDASGTWSDTISGPISGPGSVVKIRNELTTYFRNPANTYEGTTTISNGTLYAQTPGSLPGYNDGRLTVLGGASLSTHAWNGGGIGWTPEQIRDLHYASTFAANNAYLTLDTSLGSMVMPYDLTNRMGLIKQGSGSLTLSGTNARGTSETRVYGGELVVNGDGAHQYGTFLTTTANLTLTNATGMSLDVTNTSSYFADSAGNSSVIRIGGKTAWEAYMQPYNQGQGIFVVGQRGNAVVHLTDDASVRQRLYLGNYGGSAGAVYQSGNTKMHNWGGASSDGRIGMTGYGYYELNSGTFTNNGYFHLGRDFTGVGILNQSGGQFEMGSVYGGQLGLSRGGTGVVYTAGGTFRTSTQLNVGESSDNGTIRGYASFTADELADVFINGVIWMADRTNMFAAVNFNGGTVVANQLRRAIRTGSLALVNFDGGTFRPRQAGNIFDVGAYAVDAINLYAGGATLDTTNLSCTVALPLRAPDGSGVTGISVAPTPGYIGPPMVTIDGGGGTGATAVATFDSASGTLTGVRVTSPGTGYTSAPTVTLSHGGKTSHPAATAFIAANVSGGLTKLGSGDLFLTATNTYAGATTVSNGMLKIVVRDALPNGTDIAVAGGKLDLGGFTHTNGTVSATGGALINGTLVCDSLSKTGSGELLLSATVSSGDTIEINEGTLRFLSAQPGLYEGLVNGAFNTADPMASNIMVQLSTRMADTNVKPPWYDQATFVYTGYIWNRTSAPVTWTFGENVDDNVLLKIDGTTLIANGVTWNAPTIATVTLSPGAHAFEARFGNGGGGAGWVNSSWWKTNNLGFGVDFLGRNETNVANYAKLEDPGDGSLLTLTVAGGAPTNLLDAAASLVLGAGAVLDLDTYCQTFANVSGSGTLSNGTLAVSGTLAPGGTNVIGTLTVAASSGLSGSLLADVAADGSSDLLAVQGNMDLSALSLIIANPGQLNHAMQYTLMTCSGARTGAFASVSLPDSHWHVVYRADGTVKLIYVNGTLISLR
jgi:autotransporter-associated beta strand protein